MKRLFVQGIVVLSLVVFAIPAWSYTTVVGSIDVGGLDELKGWTNLDNSGDATELTWAQSIIGPSGTLGAKYDTTGGQWSLTNATGGSTFAHTLVTSPEYFLIKTGNVTTPDYQWFLFQNNGLLGENYAVINLANLGFVPTNNVSGISHIDEFNPVPIPSAMLLFGSGLGGLVGIARWRRKK